MKEQIYVLDFPRVDTSRCVYPIEIEWPEATHPGFKAGSRPRTPNDITEETRRRRLVRQECKRLGYKGNCTRATTADLKRLRAERGISE